LSRSTHDLIRAVPKGPVKDRPRRSVALQGAALAGDMTSGGVYPRRAGGGGRVPYAGAAGMNPAARGGPAGVAPANRGTREAQGA
jgi:hypothetical protein